MTITKFSITLIFLLLQLSQLTHAQPSSPGRNSDPSYGGNFSPTMGVILIVLIAALFFIGSFSIYIRHCSEGTSTTGTVGRAIGSIRRSRRAPRGLDPEVIESFPTFDYAAIKTAKIGKGALECAVCLTEFEDDDTLRLIPKCDHVFHPDCIDAWLVGHTTCPVCRCNLSDVAIGEPAPANDVVLEVEEMGSGDDDEEQGRDNNCETEGNDSMEQPLHRRMNRSRTMRNLSFGRPRWLGKFTRSFSTGHVAVKKWENMERFTLRLPDDVRKQIMSGKLERTTSLVVLPRQSSSRRGFRTGLGEGSNRGGRFGSVRVDRTVRSDRWVFTLAPPFLARAPSIKSPKVAATIPTTVATSRQASLRDAMQAELSHLPF